jgi:biopolymer transport protein TolQ
MLHWLLQTAQRVDTAPVGSAPPAGDAAHPAVEMDPVSLVLNASGPVLIVVWLLIITSIAVWFIAALKILQIRRLTNAERKFERDAAMAEDADHLFEIAQGHVAAPGARVVFELQRMRDRPKVLESVAKRELVNQQQRASTLMPLLASIGSASPFVGLFGTVYGIMDAFLRISREKSATLPVVAPAIGEALIATAIGLFAAIPAVVAYNAISKRLDDLLSAVEASASGWVALVESATQPRHMERVPQSANPVPLTRPGVGRYPGA